MAPAGMWLLPVARITNGNGKRRAAAVCASPRESHRVTFTICSGQREMADGSSIEWTDATWNPVTGCTKISAGCDNCYAARFSERFRGTPGHPFENGFDLTLRPDALSSRCVAPATDDLRQFHERPVSQRDRAQIHRAVFDTMEAAHWHTFQVLTKRSSSDLVTSCAAAMDRLRARHISGAVCKCPDAASFWWLFRSGARRRQPAFLPLCCCEPNV